jgi:hypothetical protein
MTPSSWLVDLVLRLWVRVPAPVHHNLGKAAMIKKCFWHLNVDAIKGDYLEFGVAMGHSMRSAEIAERTCHLSKLGIDHVPRKLIGFDTFASFKSNEEIDNHATWVGSNFNVELAKIRRRFKKDIDVRVFLNKCDATGLVDEFGKPTINHESTGMAGPIALLLLDMDLYGPTLSALKWCRPRLQVGTIIMLDEYFAFAGRKDRGECLALANFLETYPEIELRQFNFYGSGGAVFIVSSLTN